MLQQDAGPLEALADGGRGDVEAGGHLIAGAAFVIIGFDRVAERFGKAGEALLEGVEERVPLLCPARLPRGDVGVHPREFVVAEVVSPVLAEPFAPLVPDDAAHPGGEVAGDVEDLALLIGDDEGLLHDVAGRGGIAGQGDGVDEEVAVMEAHEFPEVRRAGIASGLAKGIGIRGHHVHRPGKIGPERVICDIEFGRESGERNEDKDF